MSQSIRHSADVDIYLIAEGRRIDVAACLGNKCRLAGRSSLPPCYAELVIVIDGQERRRPVFLSSGISEDKEQVEFEYQSDSPAEGVA